MDFEMSKKLERVAAALERIADSLEKMTKPGAIVVDKLDLSVDPPPPPVRTS